MEQFKVGDRIRLKIDASDSHFGETSKQAKRDRTVFLIKSINNDQDIKPVSLDGSDPGVMWYEDWIEHAPKITLIIKR